MDIIPCVKKILFEPLKKCNLLCVQNAMSKQNRRDIKKYLHLSENNLVDGTDKLVKIRCFIDIF